MLSTLFNVNIKDEKLKETIVIFCKAFHTTGHSCYIVGGAVRDLLMGKEPKDFDFATNCPLEVTKKHFKKVISTGEDHGTLTVLMNGYAFEVTRYRNDVATDGRRATITFSETIQEDLKRRDFTCNAIAFDPLTGEVVDPFNGIHDIENKDLKFVGDIKTRIREDHLRALRYVRFQCGKDALAGVEKDWITVLENANMYILSQERINDETSKILDRYVSGQEEFVKNCLFELQVYKNLWGRRRNEWLAALEQCVQESSLFPMAFLLGNLLGNYSCITRDLRMSAEFRKEAEMIHRILNIGCFPENVKKILHELELKKQPIHLVNDAAVWEMYFAKEKRDPKNYSQFVGELVRILERNEPYTFSDLNVTGKTLQDMGLTGKDIGDMLNKILEAVWKNPNINQMEIAQNAKV